MKTVFPGEMVVIPAATTGKTKNNVAMAISTKARGSFFIIFNHFLFMV
jgi:hypothetical protein